MSLTATARQLLPVRPRSGTAFDVAIAAVVLAGTLALLSHAGIDPSRSANGQLDLLGVVLAACSAVPIIAWRRSPLGVFVVTGAAGVLMAGLGYPLDLMLGPAVALYLLAASRDDQAPWTRRTTATVVGMLVAYLGATAAAQSSFPGVALLHNGLAWAVAWFAGERTRLRREQIAELNERALRAERDTERERLLTVAEERARIARDLHDAAGNAINVIAVRAGAARMRHHQDPDRSLRALEAIEEMARNTVEEIGVQDVECGFVEGFQARHVGLEELFGRPADDFTQGAADALACVAFVVVAEFVGDGLERPAFVAEFGGSGVALCGGVVVGEAAVAVAGVAAVGGLGRGRYGWLVTGIHGLMVTTVATGSG